MTHVFYEIGDVDFFRHITEEFCEHFFSTFRNLFKTDREKELLFPDGKTLSTDYLTEVCKNNKKELALFNCNLFDKIVEHCKENLQCKKDHDKNDYKVVLASDQVEVYEEIIRGKINELSANLSTKNLRENFQRILQYSKIASIQNLVHINVFFGDHPRERREHDRDEYIKLYTNEAEGIARKKSETDEFVYVCTKKDESNHLTHFMRDMRLIGVTVRPCDEYQAV